MFSEHVVSSLLSLFDSRQVLIVATPQPSRWERKERYPDRVYGGLPANEKLGTPIVSSRGNTLAAPQTNLQARNQNNVRHSGGSYLEVRTDPVLRGKCAC